ncbi:prostaglandin E synthase 3-like [Corticium candelabrum]|uniref:prostaglandin E synthase 3-like n=1 Tax=Corticium candelabrum TaxID=121492 RepID=UPI002E26741F|nr:prostaglandin E synthase 3-like [Corticium candelabrum]
MAEVLPSPEVVWAERSDVLYVTIRLTDIHNHKLDVTEEKLIFSGTGGTQDRPYYCELEFFRPVKPQDTKQKITQREVFLKLTKQESGSYWNCLVKGKKPHFVHTDFSRWKDEDDSEPEGDNEPELEGLMSQMGGLGDDVSGLEDTLDSDDSDNEELPDLESKPVEDEATVSKDDHEEESV